MNNKNRRGKKYSIAVTIAGILIVTLFLGIFVKNSIESSAHNKDVQAGIASNEGINVNCTLFDYYSDEEFIGNSPGFTYHTLNYEVFKAKNYDKLNKTNTLTPIPLGSFIGDRPSNYQDSMDVLLWEAFGTNANNLNKDIYNTFSAVAAFNANAPTEGYNMATLGLVDNKLTNGTVTQSYNGKKDYVPWFDVSFLKKQMPGRDLTYGKVYENLKFPFKYIESKNQYEFNSVFDTVELDIYNNELNYKGRNNEQVNDPWGSGFYPFNKPSDTIRNYGFGLKFEVSFYLPEDELNNGKEIEFSFSGDDDVWVFIDGYLALDLGGNHTRSSGSLNVTQKKSVVHSALNPNLVTARGNFFIPSASKVYTVEELKGYGITNVTTSQQAILNNHEIPFPTELINSLKPGTTHTLTMFYMERAKGTSNLNVTFNLPVEEFVTPEPTDIAIPSIEPTVDPTIVPSIVPTTTVEPDTNTGNIEVVNGEKLTPPPVSSGEPENGGTPGDSLKKELICFYAYGYERLPAKMYETIDFIIEDDKSDIYPFVLSRSADITNFSQYIPESQYCIIGEDVEDAIPIKKVIEIRPIGWIYAKTKDHFKEIKVSDFTKNGIHKLYCLKTNSKYSLLLNKDYFTDTFETGGETLWLHGNLFTKNSATKVRIIKRVPFKLE